MFSYSDGVAIAKTAKPKQKIIGLVSEFDSVKKTKTIADIESESKITPLPNTEKRFSEYIAAPSGGGKTYLATGLIKEYANVYPDKLVYVFSRGDIDDDPAFNDIECTQIPINEDLLENQLDIVEMAKESGNGCVFVFDDCGTISDCALRKEVERIICDILEVGRKYDVNIIVTNHLIIPNERKFARTIMNELTVLTIYPKCGSVQQITHALKTYWGLNKNQIQKILELDSRWVRISKGYPQYVLYEYGAYIL